MINSQYTARTAADKHCAEFNPVSYTHLNGNYSIAGATYGVFADKDCTKQLATLTTDENGNTDVVEVKSGTVYIKELSAPAGYKVDKTVYSLKVEAGKDVYKRQLQGWQLVGNHRLFR